MAENMISGLGMELGAGAVIGFLSGYAAKKVTKVIAILVGGALLVAKWLEGQGHISVDWAGVGGGFLSVGSAAADAAPSLFDAVLSTIGLGGGFAAGFYLGFRRG